MFQPGTYAEICDVVVYVEQSFCIPDGIGLVRWNVLTTPTKPLETLWSWKQSSSFLWQKVKHVMFSAGMLRLHVVPKLPDSC